MDDDLPAAHSMDTTWYAVDEHGHVGVFETGEDGALPVVAATGRNPGDPNFDVRLLDLTQLATMLARGDDPLADRPLAHAPTLDRLVAAQPDKVHLSIHFPGRTSEVTRVIEQVAALDARGVRCGVNLLVQRSRLAQAHAAARRLHAAGVDNGRIVYLPMRGTDTPTPSEVAAVAGAPFQSMTCLQACGKSPRFASIGWDKTVAWCSYTTSRRRLRSLTLRGIEQALDGLPVTFCGPAP